MDMRTEAARFASEAIPRTAEKKDRFRSNSENRGGKKRKNDKKRNGISKLKIPVVIMAGGRGTRLKPFTNILPKPLIPIKDKTAIEVIIENLRSYGLDNFTISIHEKSEIIKAFFHELQPKFKVNFIKEPKPLGTIGSLNLLNKKKIKNNILITNCDILSNFDLIDFYSCWSFYNN